MSWVTPAKISSIAPGRIPKQTQVPSFKCYRIFRFHASRFGLAWELFEILTPFLGTFSFGHFETLLLKIYTPVLLVLPRQSLSAIVKR